MAAFARLRGHECVLLDPHATSSTPPRLGIHGSDGLPEAAQAFASA
jgi:hypothetical protein